MYIKNIIFKEFRALKNQRVELGRYFTVLAGPNMTGKSTVLAVLANCAELKSKKGRPLNAPSFRADFSEILKGSQTYDKSGSERILMDVMDADEKTILTIKCRTSWQKYKKGMSQKRFRLIPGQFREGVKINDKKLEVPVIYLGLSRLFPLGEAFDDKVQINKTKNFFVKHPDYFEEYKRVYAHILNIHEDELPASIEEIKIDGIKKTKMGVTTHNYDHYSNSAGQDNLGQILSAIISFQYLRSTNETTQGGLLIIDEFDATLHPVAQEKLYKYLYEQAKNLKIQIIVSSHSLTLLHNVSRKIKNNTEEGCNDIELIYFDKSNGSLKLYRNKSYNAIQNALLLVTDLQSKNLIKVYTEDQENRWFLKKIASDLLERTNLLDISIGCNNMITLMGADVEYFKNCILVFDGDLSEASENKIKGPMKDVCLKLPSNGPNSPEKEIYEFLLNLHSECDLWGKAFEHGISKDSLRERGPDSDEYEKYPKGRERYKAWFKDYLPYLEKLDVYDIWARENSEKINDFREKLKHAIDILYIRSII